MPPLWPLVLGTVLLRYKAKSGSKETCTVLLSPHQAVGMWHSRVWPDEASLHTGAVRGEGSN